MGSFCLSNSHVLFEKKSTSANDYVGGYFTGGLKPLLSTAGIRRAGNVPALVLGPFCTIVCVDLQRMPAIASRNRLCLNWRRVTRSGIPFVVSSRNGQRLSVMSQEKTSLFHSRLIRC